MALFADNISLRQPLMDPLRKINRKAQDSLQAALGNIAARQQASALASGRIRGEYAPAELALAGQNASTSIEDALAGALGGTSYSEQLKDMEHKRNLDLAREIGALSAPSLLEQVLGGLGGASKTGAQFYGLYEGVRKPKVGNNRPSYGSPLRLDGGY